jgi:hypothetical protein
MPVKRDFYSQFKNLFYLCAIFGKEEVKPFLYLYIKNITIMFLIIVGWVNIIYTKEGSGFRFLRLFRIIIFKIYIHEKVSFFIGI